MFDNKYKNVFVFILYILSRPKLIFYVFKCHLPTYIQLEWLNNWKVKTFIDVGAHEGQEIRAMKVLNPSVQIYAFEPQHDLYTRLQHYSDSHTTIINAAVGDRKFTTEIRVPHYSPAASLLKPTKELTQEFGNFDMKTTSVITLDSFFNKKQFSGLTALKIDTQGYEMNVLKGAIKLLSRIDIVYVETPLIKMYQGSCLFDEIYELLHKNGFIYQGTIPDGQFWPHYYIQEVQNSIFIKSALLKR